MIDDLDALIAAPEHHSLILDNESVRVLETVIEPGDATPLHTHCWPCVLHVLSWSEVVRRDEHGNILMDTRDNPDKLQPGQTIWSPALALHTLENVGTQTVRVINVEIKPS